MAEFWISNASPLITLAAIDRLDLFAALHAEIRVPSTVLREVGAGASTDRADERVRESGRFIIVQDLPIAIEVTRWGLDPGEAQAVSQGLETAAKGVILDDLAGRRCAQALGLRVFGTVGLKGCMTCADCTAALTNTGMGTTGGAIGLAACVCTRGARRDHHAALDDLRFSDLISDSNVLLDRFTCLKDSVMFRQLTP